MTSIGKLTELIKVNEENFNKIIALKTKCEKLGYVDSALYSIAECFLDYSHMDAFGIYNGDEFIGFTSIFAKDNFGQIINFFIKDKFQNKTYGTRAVEALLQLFKDRYKVDFVYIIDSNQVSDNEKVLGLNCPNCGAPITDIGVKTCKYCGSGALEIVNRVWSFNNIESY